MVPGSVPPRVDQVVVWIIDVVASDREPKKLVCRFMEAENGPVGWDSVARRDAIPADVWAGHLEVRRIERAEGGGEKGVR
jgi:hypothetical protein